MGTKKTDKEIIEDAAGVLAALGRQYGLEEDSEFTFTANWSHKPVVSFAEVMDGLNDLLTRIHAGAPGGNPVQDPWEHGL